MDITLEVFGEKILAREILRVGEHAADSRPAWDRIADQLRDYETSLFDTEGGSGPGGKWKELAESTLEAKRADGLDERILHATGALRDSLTARGDSQQEFISTPTFMVFGTKVPYAGYHQLGQGVPQRREIQLTEVQKQDIIRTLQLWIMRGALR